MNKSLNLFTKLASLSCSIRYPDPDSLVSWVLQLWVQRPAQGTGLRCQCDHKPRIYSWANSSFLSDTRGRRAGGGLEGGVSPLVSVCQSDLMDTSVTAGSDSELIFNFPILSFGFVSELIVMYPGCGRDQWVPIVPWYWPLPSITGGASLSSDPRHAVTQFHHKTFDRVPSNGCVSFHCTVGQTVPFLSGILYHQFWHSEFEIR